LGPEIKVGFLTEFGQKRVDQKKSPGQFFSFPFLFPGSLSKHFNKGLQLIVWVLLKLLNFALSLGTFFRNGLSERAFLTLRLETYFFNCAGTILVTFLGRTTLWPLLKRLWKTPLWPPFHKRGPKVGIPRGNRGPFSWGNISPGGTFFQPLVWGGLTLLGHTLLVFTPPGRGFPFARFCRGSSALALWGQSAL